MDIRKIALYLAGKLPPDYKKQSAFHLIKLLQVIDEKYYTDAKIKFIKEESWSDEEFYFSILDSLWRSGKNQSDIQEQSYEWFIRIMTEYDVPKEYYIENKLATSVFDNSDIGNALKLELATIVVGSKNTRNSDAKDFENFIWKLLDFLFAWSMKKLYSKSQIRNYNGLDIRDWILLNNPDNWKDYSIWFREDIVKKEYDSSFITIECKNYQDPAKQDPIISTLKYLEKPGIWRFWLMFTRNWLSVKWNNKIIDLLKWNIQKQPICLMVLDDSDINKMIDLKINSKEVEGYLMDKYFDLQTKI